MCIVMGKRLALLWNNFLLLQNILGYKCKNPLFKEKMESERVFVNKTKCMVVTNWPMRLEKKNS